MPAAPVGHGAVEIAPAQRFDVVVDFGRYRPGSTVRLVDTWGTGGNRDVLEFRVGASARDDTAVPAMLSEMPAASPGRASCCTATTSNTRTWR